VSIEFHVDVDFSSAPVRADISKVASSIIVQATALALRYARQFASEFKDTGQLAQSLVGETAGISGRVYSPLPYASPMEAGRRAGARMPPPSALTGWMRRHGIPTSAAFVVARSIGRRGIPGRFYLQRAYQAMAAELGDVIARSWRNV
jgi:hypothetical protein